MNSHVRLRPSYSIVYAHRRDRQRLVRSALRPACNLADPSVARVTGERLTYDKAAKKGKPLHKNDVNKLRNTQIVCVEYDDITYGRRPPL
jgi:hypothetical protein